MNWQPTRRVEIDTMTIAQKAEEFIAQQPVLAPGSMLPGRSGAHQYVTRAFPGQNITSLSAAGIEGKTGTVITA